MINTRGFKNFDDWDDEDLEFDIKVPANIDDIYYLKQIKARKLYLNCGIDSDSVQHYIQHILQYNADDKDIPINERKPILFYLTSNGGSVDAGFQLIDLIKLSKTPIYTINLGYQYSMGFLIGLAGYKRFATPNSKFLLHDGQNFVYDSGSKVQDLMEFNKKVENRIKNYVLDRTKISADEFDKNLRVEWYMFADEAKENGCVDYIVGEDCELADIL